jgi:hypothetical protein
MRIKVTICNDDDQGRKIQVQQMKPFGRVIYPTVLQQPGKDGQNNSQQYSLKDGEILIVSAPESE